MIDKEGTPIVSIWCLVYNHEPYLRQCLDGFVLQKTNFCFEAIVHDDVSTDDSASIIREYAEKYPNIIKPIFEKENQHSKHDGSLDKIMYDACVGKYIAKCEGDDYWTDPNKLQKQVGFMEENPDVGLCVTDFCYQRDRGELSEPAFEKMGLFKPQTFEEHLFNAGYIGPMTWLYRRVLYERCKPDNGVIDGTFVMALNFFALSKVAYLPDCTAVYRSHDGSATAQTDPKKAFRYEKGIFDSQIIYANKYNLSQSVVNQLKIQGYATNILPALEADDRDFIQEALVFYRSQGMEMKWFVEKCKQYVGFHRQYERISHSKAYRLGKALLKPFKVFKKK